MRPGAIFGAAGSLFVQSTIGATILGAAAFSCFRGIREMLAQEMRVLRGWFPENPKRADYYVRRRKTLGELGKYPSHKKLKDKVGSK